MSLNTKVNTDAVLLIMAEKEMNCSDLERISGITHATMLRMMNGSNCNIATIGKVAKALCVSPLDIMERK